MRGAVNLQTFKTMTEPDICPHCKADLKGEPIPEESRHYYGKKTHFLRTIGIYSQERDRTEFWQCPDCGKRWSRF